MPSALVPIMLFVIVIRLQIPLTSSRRIPSPSLAEMTLRSITSPEELST